MATNCNRRLVREETLAEILDLSTRTLRSYRAEGRIPYIRLSPRAVRYDLDEVFAALDERKVAARKTRTTK